VKSLEFVKRIFLTENNYFAKVVSNGDSGSW